MKKRMKKKRLREIRLRKEKAISMTWKEYLDKNYPARKQEESCQCHSCNSKKRFSIDDYNYTHDTDYYDENDLKGDCY